MIFIGAQHRKSAEGTSGTELLDGNMPVDEKDPARISWRRPDSGQIIATIMQIAGEIDEEEIQSRTNVIQCLGDASKHRFKWYHLEDARVYIR